MVSMNEIISWASDYSGFTIEQIKSKRRHKKLANIRHLCYYFMRKNGFTYPQIGTFMKKHHTAVIHGGKRCSEIIERLAQDNASKQKLFGVPTRTIPPGL